MMLAEAAGIPVPLPALMRRCVMNKPAAGASEALVQEADGRQLTATVFAYESPVDLAKPKGIARLCRSDIIYSSVQILKEGGENNLHAHSAQDGVWIVLKGRARFYGKGDVLLAELTPLQGLHIPRGFYYWFEKAGEEQLEILQVEAIDKTVSNKRLDATPAKDFAQQVQHF
jgi:mannose-6-phosphate isomerase-like protein (cupin superfamily)